MTLSPLVVPIIGWHGEHDWLFAGAETTIGCEELVVTPRGYAENATTTAATTAAVVVIHRRTRVFLEIIYRYEPPSSTDVFLPRRRSFRSGFDSRVL